MRQLSSMKRSLILNAKNIPGWRTKRKIVVFESDDWGGNRMPSAETLARLIETRVIDAGKVVDAVDTLASKPDLDALAETLMRVRDSRGRHPVVTMFVNPANPDFRRIEDAGFQQYYPEPFPATMARDDRFIGTLASWSNAVQEGLFHIAYHGREHLNVSLWMSFLQDSESLTRTCFKERYYAVPERNLPAQCSSFRAANYCPSEDLWPDYRSILKDGLLMLKGIFGTDVSVYCPPNGISHPQIDADLSSLGVRTIVTNYVRLNTDLHGGITRQLLRFGEINRHSQVYHVRNCVFEPVNGNPMAATLRSIEAAFRWKKPAVISTHALNYIGGLSRQNRENGLADLGRLLNEILKRWPGVEFLSSAELTTAICHERSAA